MEAVILAGGTGSRLKPYTTLIPKPIMPVGGQSVLRIIIEQLRLAHVRRITLAVNYMADIIMALIGDGSKFGLEIRYSLETKPLGTVGPLKIIPDLPDHFLVMNGDILTNLNYQALFDHHLASGTNLTIATYSRTQKVDFGVLKIERDTHRLTDFQEKPNLSFDVSMGVYVFSRQLLERVPSDQPYGLDNLVLDMLASGDPINTYPFDGYWLDIGRPDDYDLANQDADKILKKIMA